MNITRLDTQQMTQLPEICQKFGVEMTEHQLLVNIDTQRLYLIKAQAVIRSYLISTALNGVGQEEGSGKTPLGLHTIGEKIGDNADPLAIFKARVSTGALAKIDDGEKLIVGRILWLQGAQIGFNQGKDSAGKNVDTHDRYIYIHGTNDTANIGKAVSAGCVRMVPDDVIELFKQVAEGTPVYIYNSPCA